MLKRIITGHLYFAILSVCLFFMWATGVYATYYCPIDPHGTYIEAEHFTGSYNLVNNPGDGDRFTVVEDTNANGGYVLVSGSSGAFGRTPRNAVKKYKVHFHEAGTYEIWARGMGLSDVEDSMFFTVNDGTTNAPWKAWEFDDDSQYHWIDNMRVGSPNTFEIAAAGVHTIKIAMRESNSRIDGFFIIKGGGFIPTDTIVPALVTSLNPRDNCGVFWLAEPRTLGPTCFFGYNAASRSFTLTNLGVNDDTAAASVSSDQTWAVVDTSTIPPLNAGQESDLITVSFNTSSLPVGTHQAQLTITTDGNDNLPPDMIIPIILRVKAVPTTAACGEIPLYAQDLVSPAIMVQLDTSGSMRALMEFAPGRYKSRMDIAEDVLKEVFLDRSIAWGFATWAGGNCRPSDTGRDYTNFRIGIRAHDQTHQDYLQDKADDGFPRGCTPLAPSMRAGLEYFKGNRLDGHYGEKFSLIPCQPRILVMVTDGIGNTGTTNATIDAVMEQLIDEGITVVVVGFGLSKARAIQLHWIAERMKIAGEKSDDDFLYHLHHEVNGRAVPFMAQNRQEFIAAMNSIVSNVKAQVFRGSTPAPTTSADDGNILITASFNASNWSGELTATKFDRYTGELEAGPVWRAREKIVTGADGKPAPNAFIYDASVPSRVSLYTDASLNNDNFICKPLGSIINSTPVIVGQPPFFYGFDDYFSFKYDPHVMDRETLVYVAANDGALHAFRLSDGTEKWRFYPNAVKEKLNLAGTRPQDDMCSPAYCHRFILDGSPRPADIFIPGTTDDGFWRTIITTGLGKGGKSFFALDVTYGEDFDEPAKADGTEVKSRFLWEFTDTDDIELGLATSRPATVRLAGDNNNPQSKPVWATFFGSGSLETPLKQNNKEAYLFAVNSWDKNPIWKDNSTPPVDTYKIKLHPTELLNDVPASPLLIDHNDDNKMDRVYLGNLYGNMYRVKNINLGNTPVVEMLFNAEKTDHSTPVTAMAGYAYANNNNVWIYFGTGKYQEQIDKVTRGQQYFFGLFDENASTGYVTSRDANQVPTSYRPYKKSDLVAMTAEIIEAAHALDKDGNPVDINKDGNIDSNDLRKYRTITCDPHLDNCNPDNRSWLLELATPADSGSERVITRPLIVGNIVFFATFVPDGDICGGGGKTWLFAVDWETGHFVTDAVFDINRDGLFDHSDKEVQVGTEKQRVAGIFIGGGRPSQEIALHGNILFIGTTGDDTGVQPAGVLVNIPEQRTKLRAWRQP